MTMMTVTTAVRRGDFVVVNQRRIINHATQASRIFEVALRIDAITGPFGRRGGNSHAKCTVIADHDPVTGKTGKPGSRMVVALAWLQVGGDPW